MWHLLKVMRDNNVKQPNFLCLAVKHLSAFSWLNQIHLNLVLLAFVVLTDSFYEAGSPQPPTSDWLFTSVSSANVTTPQTASRCACGMRTMTSSLAWSRSSNGSPTTSWVKPSSRSALWAERWMCGTIWVSRMNALITPPAVSAGHWADLTSLLNVLLSLQTSVQTNQLFPELSACTLMWRSKERRRSPPITFSTPVCMK